MAIATGVLVAAGVTAAAGAYSAHKQSSSSNKALKSQEKANADAMAYERENQAKNEAQFAKQQAAYESQWNTWQKNRRDLLKRYGVNVPEPQMGGQTGGVSPQRATLRDLTGVPPVGGNAGMPQGGTPPAGQLPPELAALGAQTDGMAQEAGLMGRPRPSLRNWNDWSQYASIPRA